jgi:hypothetical protein
LLYFLLPIIIQTGLLHSVSVIFTFTLSQEIAQFFHFSGTNISSAHLITTKPKSQLSLNIPSFTSLSSSNILTTTASNLHLCFCNFAFTKSQDLAFFIFFE